MLAKLFTSKKRKTEKILPLAGGTQGVRRVGKKIRFAIQLLGLEKEGWKKERREREETLQRGRSLLQEKTLNT